MFELHILSWWCMMDAAFCTMLCCGYAQNNTKMHLPTDTKGVKHSAIFTRIIDKHLEVFSLCRSPCSCHMGKPQKLPMSCIFWWWKWCCASQPESKSVFLVLFNIKESEKKHWVPCWGSSPGSGEASKWQSAMCSNGQMCWNCWLLQMQHHFTILNQFNNTWKGTLKLYHGVDGPQKPKSGKESIRKWQKIGITKNCGSGVLDACERQIKYVGLF